MAKCTLTKFYHNSDKFKPGNIWFNLQRNYLHMKQAPIKEIKIPIQYGHIAAKVWGNDQNRPILALHGWQDNAGTWDTLAPLLCKNRSIIAVDFPGHGLSSWIPPGMHYYTWELPRLIKYLKNYFKWDKVSILAHSMGSTAGMRFTSIFPDDVDMYVAIETLIYTEKDTGVAVKDYPKIFEDLDNLQRNRDNKEPPSYSIEEITKIWHISSRNSIAMESVKHLAKRGIKQSSSDPNKYYYSRDYRLKKCLFPPESDLFVNTLIRRIKCPLLYIKAIDSDFSCDKLSIEIRESLKTYNNNYEIQFVPGTHHLHLNNPQTVAPLILNFARKHNLQI